MRVDYIVGKSSPGNTSPHHSTYFFNYQYNIKMIIILPSRVEIAQYSNGLWAGWARFNFWHSIQTSAGAHPASNLMGTRISFLGGVKWQGHEADPSLPSSVKVKKCRSYTSTPSYVFMAQFLNNHT
jgi:hypothetical protein